MPQPDLHSVRRNNLLRLITEHTHAHIASGESHMGAELAFATKLQVSKSLLSQLKSSRNISDAMAAQIEKSCKREKGWLSMVHNAEDVSLDDLVSALRAWHKGATRENKASLMAQLSTTGRHRA